ncbi:PssD/Cps14F family polysaccharide biosynthesis glycosyltransferase [uncultured Clostridium sp.]|uniref:PssD/Cps14F family polysaccharide biosynthesis glycosyltransferase n=1 Tax=uncultured Clostridium sp. TaxID=59620 RepID=UPI0025FF498A|nr:PssD/Cps14F family polysaccharide biosynthesis glycosyltransferase [uncultured Clostridium sp.]
MKDENKKCKNTLKACLVGSSGGHLTHLYMLKPFWKELDRFWVTFDKEDARSVLDGEKIYSCYFPTNRNIKNLIKNTFLAFKVLKKENPDILISSGAAVAVPFFYLAKLKGKKLIYIEVYDRIDKPTMTGKLVYPIVDKFIVQWEEQKKVYPKAVNLGSIF